MSHNELYEVVAGLEVHVQLNTKTKLFCSDTSFFGMEPNTQVSIISLAHPGTLPKLNQAALLKAIRLGLACHCEIVQHNYFARKNYFYPDLPKGYQISQHTTPVCKNGYLQITAEKNEKKIRINRIHIEEDAGKSIHDENSAFSNIDFNRAGMPLLEIVTEPDIRSAEEAYDFVSRLRKLVRTLDVCDGNMEQGSLRCDVNISVRKKGTEALGTRVEVKNLNSIRYIKKAIEYETSRLISILESGERVYQETRGFNETDFTTYSIRRKEDEDDYRYFPEPDLPPFYISDVWINQIREGLPEVPEVVKEHLVNNFQISDYDAGHIAEDPELTDFFYRICNHCSNYKAAANWTLGPIRNHLLKNEITIEEIKFPASALADIISLIDSGFISYGIATQQLFPLLLEEPEKPVSLLLEEKKLGMETSSEQIDRMMEAALSKHSEKIIEYKRGKKGLISLFVGEIMKMSKGKVDAKMITEKLIEKLKA